MTKPSYITEENVKLLYNVVPDDEYFNTHKLFLSFNKFLNNGSGFSLMTFYALVDFGIKLGYFSCFGNTKFTKFKLVKKEQKREMINNN